MKLAISRTGLNFYLRHVVYGEEQREIARQSGVFPSNVCRHVQRIEAVREDEELPEWCAVLDALEAWLIANHDAFPEGGVTEETVLAAFGVAPSDLEAAFWGASSPASWRGALIVSAPDMPMATVLHLGNPTGARVPRNLVLAAFALGVLRATGGKRLRAFSVVRDVRPEIEAGADDDRDARHGAGRDEERRARVIEEFPVVRINRKNPELIGTADLRTAQEFALLWQMRGAEMASVYDRLRAAITPRLLRILELTCGQRVGVEVAESEMGLPARSGKLLLSVALESARFSGVLR